MKERTFACAFERHAPPEMGTLGVIGTKTHLCLQPRRLGCSSSGVALIHLHALFQISYSLRSSLLLLCKCDLGTFCSSRQSLMPSNSHSKCTPAMNPRYTPDKASARTMDLCRLQIPRMQYISATSHSEAERYPSCWTLEGE